MQELVSGLGLIFSRPFYGYNWQNIAAINVQFIMEINHTNA
jgi:hypothetical protein